jgi:hypothetical protein
MSLSIEQIENQILQIQKSLDELKTMKLKVSRSFTGQYFDPYRGKQYRRMESEGVPVWEVFNSNKNWLLLGKEEIQNLEAIYQRSLVPTPENKISE